MRSLLDVNVLLALTDSRNVHHQKARAWRLRSMSDGWATCPLTQNGFLRVSSQPGYSTPIPIADSIRILAQMVARPDHSFWPDSISLLDDGLIDYSRLLGPRQLTDVYLLALAFYHGGRFVTFDRGISLKAVRGASAKHLELIGS